MRGSTAILVAGLIALVAGLSGTSLADDRSVPETDVAPAGDAGSTDPAPPLVEPGEAPWIVEEDRTSPEQETDPLEGENAQPREEGQDVDDSGRDGRKGKGKEKGDDEKQPLAKASVTIEDFQFKPETITVAPGDEITWTNRDTAQHNAVDRGDPPEFETALLEKGQSETVPINTAGTYDYICTVHPDMRGKVVVRAESSGTDDTSGTSSGTGSTFPTGGTGTDFSTGGSSGGGGSLPNTGQDQLPLLLLGAGLIVFGLLARAFHEYWIWR